MDGERVQVLGVVQTVVHALLRGAGRRAALLGQPKRSPTEGAGEQLRQARELAGLTQRDLAHQLGWSRSLLAAAERGQRSVPPDIQAWARGVHDVTGGGLAHPVQSKGGRPRKEPQEHQP